MKKRVLIVCFLFVAVCFLDTDDSYADFTCPTPSYDASDLEAVRTIVSDGSAVLSRMIVLASVSGIDKYSCTQRMALNAEYVALIDIFDQMGSEPNQKVTRLTRRYLKEFINSKYLKFNGSTILANPPYTSMEECAYLSQFTASTALSVVTGAMRNLTYCAVSIPLRTPFRPIGR